MTRRKTVTRKTRPRVAGILITRPRAESLRLASLLKAQGHRVYLAPLYKIIKLPPALTAHAPLPEAILATSANAFLQWTAPRSWRNLPLYLVGEKTRRAARLAGLMGRAVTAETAKALLSRLRKTGRTKPLHLFYLRGRERDKFLEENLRAAGFRISGCDAYRTRACAWPKNIRAAFKAGKITHILLFSARAATRFVKMRKTIGPDAASLTLLCLSRTVSKAAGQAPDQRKVAAKPTERALLNLLSATLRTAPISARKDGRRP